MEPTIKKQYRIGYIDGIRGFAIFSVVCSHVSFVTWGLTGYDTLVGQIIYSYFLPIFFFISGFLAYKAPENYTINFLCERIKRRFLELIVPLAIFYAFYQWFYSGDVFIFLKKGFSMYWFTPVLFEMLVLYYIIAVITKRAHHSWLEDVLLIGCSIFLLVVLVKLRPDENSLWNLFGLENFTKYFQYLSLGILCKKYNKLFFRIIENKWFVSGILILYIVLMTLFFKNQWPKTNIYYQLIHDLALRYLGVLIVFITFYNTRKIFERGTRISRVLELMGRRSLDIYFIHYFFFFSLPQLLILVQSGIVMELTCVIVISSMIVALSLGVSYILKQSPVLSKWLFGSK